MFNVDNYKNLAVFKYFNENNFAWGLVKRTDKLKKRKAREKKERNI